MSIGILNRNIKKMEVIDEERSNKVLRLQHNIANITKENKLLSRDIIKKQH